ncbi:MULTISPECIES: hypothetical protein [Burkholderia]|uniref:DUF4238 domain-containing protein n=1 Tax=Burkholderia pyrrocinia TaxID=60550 RepID=A0A318I8Q4_BURPY|nr:MULTISPECIES: hypothetical protein [Burkholderia]PXX28030.1 hypothetical protein NA66_10191 [Burkholderia pyrrocinia]SFW84943.1 hypothetical protein SAMN03159384_06003 [Burkholderia sp. NFACC33-1]SFY45450.1 hypothetical protein SAMN03159408_06210 [Burkholderia sp. NFPP32]
MAGKRQHYVPRFLQRGFLNDPLDEAQRTWLHRRGAKERLVGIRDVGVGEYFYSKLSTDGTATLDDLITEVEGDLDRELSILKGAQLGERIDPCVAARLTAHLMMRTAHVRSVFELGATLIIDSARSLYGDPSSARSQLGVDGVGTAFEKEMESALEARSTAALPVPRPLVRRMTSFLARERFDALHEELASTITHVLNEITRKLSSSIREAHNKALESARQSHWEEELAQLSWQTQAVSGAILPDCIALVRVRGQEFAPLLLREQDQVELVVLPIAHDRLLIGSSSIEATIDVASLNAASAACSSSFFISANAADGIGLSDSIGQRSAQVIDNSVRDVLSTLRQPVGNDMNRPHVEPTVTELETLPSFSFSLTCSGFADNELAERLGKIVATIVREAGRDLPISILDGITFAADYPAALKGLDRGDPAFGIAQTQPREYGRPVAQAVDVIREGKAKCHIVIDADIAIGLLSEDVDCRAQSTHMILSMLANLSHAMRYETGLNEHRPVTADAINTMLHPCVSGAPSGYYCARESAFSDPSAGQRYSDLVKDSLAGAQEAILKARLAYRTHNDLDTLLGVALPRISFVLRHVAEWLGHRDGLPPQDTFPGSKLPAELKAHGLDLWLELFGRDLRNLYDAEGQFTAGNIFALDRHVERLLWTVNICPWPMEDGRVYVSVPGNDEALLMENPSRNA